ncbi:hypothetical protein BXZ70DRAFT_637251 [Cristinia sonorae]|uniref:F-box domain-containing protein n=1 Tax=Cristinia sonorae TaxID=1940300 RepID=A0A8K0XK94_9AGAR|nr:hypothetical protein BXZ70DRAFT_637251 [Cristinia sonorae]
MPRFSDFPNEVIEKILLTADVLSVRQFAQVSKRFRAFTTDSLSLVYKCELFDNGMVDGRPGGLDTASRLRSLQDRRIAWKTIKPTTRKRITLALNDLPWSHNDTHIVWYDGSNRLIHVLQVPSFFRNIEENSWVLDVVGEIAREEGPDAVIADASQDLLVCASIDSGHNDCSTLEVVLQRLTNGNMHPESQNPVIRFTWPYLYNSFDPLSACLGGDYICALARPDGLPLHRRRFPEDTGYYARMLAVLNWKTGSVCLSIVGESVSCAFIDNHYLLIGYDDPQSYILSVVDLRKCLGIVSDAPEILSTYSLFQLRLPDKPTTCDSYTAEIFAAPSPMSATSDLNILPQVPFHTNSDRIFQIEFEAASSHLEGSLLRLLVRSTTIHDLIGRSGQIPALIQWDEWGPHGCVVLPHSSSRFSGAVYGGSVVFRQPLSSPSAQEGDSPNPPANFFIFELPVAMPHWPFVPAGDNQLFVPTTNVLDIDNIDFSEVDPSILARGVLPGSDYLGTDCVVIDRRGFFEGPDLEILCF